MQRCARACFAAMSALGFSEHVWAVRVAGAILVVAEIVLLTMRRTRSHSQRSKLD